MTADNVCFVVAYKDEDGFYIPMEYVQPSAEDAVQEAAELLGEDPQCDPRIIQVILDPVSPAVAAEGLVALLSRELEQCSAKAAPGLERAIEVVEESTVKVVADLDLSPTPEEMALKAEEEFK